MNKKGIDVNNSNFIIQCSVFDIQKDGLLKAAACGEAGLMQLSIHQLPSASADGLGKEKN